MDNLDQQIRADISQFFENTDNMNHNDKKEALRILLSKYAQISKAEHLMDYHDLHSIISKASTSFANKTFPCFLGNRKRKVPQGEQSNLCLIESTIGHLNKIGCLKKLPKFDYREDKL